MRSIGPSEISREGYRYNIGVKERTVANPMIRAGVPAARISSIDVDFRISTASSGRSARTLDCEVQGERDRPTHL